LKIPKELHDKFKYYPLAPSHEEVKYSTDMIEIIKKQNQEIENYNNRNMRNKFNQDEKYDLIDENPGKDLKLICSLNDKQSYLIHFKLLKLYLELGLQITKVHKILKFDQDYIMKNYIEFNTKQRINSQFKYQQDMYKLMNNSIFGKTCENIKNRKSFKIESRKRQQQKLFASPYYKTNKVIKQRFECKDDLLIIEMRKKEIEYNRPIFIGASILDLSKIVTYNFYYNIVYNHFVDKDVKLSLLMTDTDSVMLHFESKNVNINLQHEIDNFLTKYNSEFYFSEFPIDHKFHNKTNAFVPGKFKDECKGNEMNEFCGIRSKVYSF
jgi:hypothetical protein